MNTRRSFRPVKHLIRTLAVLSLTGMACGVRADIINGNDPVVARTNGLEFRVDELREEIETLSARDQAVLSANPSLLDKTVRSLVAQRLILNEAQKADWESNPEFMAQMEQLREKVLVESYLNSVSEPSASYPSESELQAAYHAASESLVRPRQMHLAQIYISLPEGSSAEARGESQARLDGLVAQLENPYADFALLAQVNSDERKSATQGGELGWLADSQLQPQVRDAVAMLNPGQTSEPVLLDDGWHILKVLDVREAHAYTLDEVREVLTQRLRARQAQLNRQAYLQRILQENPIQVNELALAGLVPSPVAGAVSQ